MKRSYILAFQRVRTAHCEQVLVLKRSDSYPWSLLIPGFFFLIVSIFSNIRPSSAIFASQVVLPLLMKSLLCLCGTQAGSEGWAEGTTRCLGTFAGEGEASMEEFMGLLDVNFGLTCMPISPLLQTKCTVSRIVSPFLSFYLTLSIFKATFNTRNTIAW